MLIVNISYNDAMRAIERRAYLRVPDDVHIKHLIVTEDQTRVDDPARLLGLKQSFSLRRDLYNLELDSRNLRAQLDDSDRTLGSLFHNMNQRFELIVTALMLEVEASSDDSNTFDISPAGVSCTSDVLHTEDTLLALRLIFRPSQLGLACFGRVRYCLLGADDEYKLGIQFISLDATSETLLARHIASLQSQARRMRLHKT
jgi:hypothetical protein